ncbi:MBL fold metallo-hydrolase [Taibaiella chishuiensis]|uniref:L-ascorbate metabolism protein UlaG (Beta-lactamase superfamily) n=1 Tax=Taibaiella chishuiensis TaxID=1434707 RepID=A0A2P8D5Y3_9BACT|nr:MBL fold metallo-hydrolase [Taibaiella chishuiensis]PSK92635.1 L-ascorbate metabolism protein UlaG (beta-lactamase superfamily) [Taibaiella chishuiensis]
MKTTTLQLIRNATVLFNYGGFRFLIDPMLATPGAYPALPGTPHAHLRNPLTSLPVPVTALTDPDAIVVTHLHPDHWDKAAMELLPKDKPVYAQNDNDADNIRAAGFTAVQVFGDTAIGAVRLRKMPGQHGSDEAYADPQMAAVLGAAAGLYFSLPGAPSVYFVGDTIWIDAVAENLQQLQPDIVVLNAGEARLDAFGPIIMGQEDVLRVHRLLPRARIVAIHMEALNHCVLSRESLRAYVTAHGMDAHVFIPADGEILDFSVE